ncbi:hypothetical protein Aph02nite_48670 [Actinoplanes philippinensis]|uniref:Uncharacterized protein n=1 Tax=Actinoplanes philippinensis TaxID=35752 RepID=A0A1I2HXZ1_9ACTN|nr:zinc ribbon domain-containing protein [Actinoplanes philippinensis]GIE78917.1 hypothetical protein Aph02nite_48670 [Actinoplanes philippinensis]SFF34230.1 hypothetical protein SAMN05421541_10921 [Actinoplanes philippinensis]
MSRRASGILLFVLSVPLLLLGVTAGKDAARETDVRAWQLSQAAGTTDAMERERFTEYAESTQRRIDEAAYNRTMLLVAAAAGIAGGIVVLATGRRRRQTEPADPATAPVFVACAACGWRISNAATACPQCGHPHQLVAPAADAPPTRAGQALRVFYAGLIVAGLGAAVVIYTVLFDSLSETTLVRVSPFWIFPAVFGYYGLVAQRMEARLQATHLDTVSDQLLRVIRETGTLGQIFSFLVHAPFLLVKSRQPWVTALVGSLIWAIALTLFFSVVFPTL